MKVTVIAIWLSAAAALVHSSPPPKVEYSEFSPEASPASDRLVARRLSEVPTLGPSASPVPSLTPSYSASSLPSSLQNADYDRGMYVSQVVKKAKATKGQTRRSKVEFAEDDAPFPTLGPSASPIPTQIPSTVPSWNLQSGGEVTTSPTGKGSKGSSTKEPSVSESVSEPSIIPSPVPSSLPVSPTDAPTSPPTFSPTGLPTYTPSSSPTPKPTAVPTSVPTINQTSIESVEPPTGSHPTSFPTMPPKTRKPTPKPSSLPTANPTLLAKPPMPTRNPTMSPTGTPTLSPTGAPTMSPTGAPTLLPSPQPTDYPTMSPTSTATTSPPTDPTSSPTVAPTDLPTETPVSPPTSLPTQDDPATDGSRDICSLRTSVDCRTLDASPCDTLAAVPLEDMVCTTRPTELEWLYRAGNCDESSNNQTSFECTDHNRGPGSAFRVHIKVSGSTSNEEYFSGTVFQGTGGFPIQSITMKSTTDQITALDTSIDVVIRRDSSSGQVLQRMSFSIACDSENVLKLGNTFGALQLSRYSNNDGSSVSGFASITWRYRAENEGADESILSELTTDTNGKESAVMPNITLSSGQDYTIFVRETILLQNTTFSGRMAATQDKGAESECSATATYLFSL